jgi:hypothetical protein
VSTRAKFDVAQSKGPEKTKTPSEKHATWKIGLVVGLFAVAGLLIFWNLRPEKGTAPISAEQQQQVDRLSQGMQADKATQKALEVPEPPENTVDAPGSRMRPAPK